MARRFKRRLFQDALPKGTDLGRHALVLADGTGTAVKATNSPERALQWQQEGLNARAVPRLGDAHLGPLSTEQWPAGWPSLQPPAKGM